MYAKIVNEKPVYTSRPKWVEYNGKSISNASDDILQELGYYKVQETEMPTDAPEGQHYESHLEYTDGVVSQVWSLVNDPELVAEPTQEERIASLEEQNDMLTQCILEMSEQVYQ